METHLVGDTPFTTHSKHPECFLKVAGSHKVWTTGGLSFAAYWAFVMSQQWHSYDTLSSLLVVLVKSIAIIDDP